MDLCPKCKTALLDGKCRNPRCKNYKKGAKNNGKQHDNGTNAARF